MYKNLVIIQCYDWQIQHEEISVRREAGMDQIEYILWEVQDDQITSHHIPIYGINFFPY